MLILGVVLLVLGFLLGIPLLYTLGIILAVVGAGLLIAGSAGRQIGTRRHYW